MLLVLAGLLDPGYSQVSETIRALRGGLARVAAALAVLAGVATLADGWFRQSCSTLEQVCHGRRRPVT